MTEAEKLLQETKSAVVAETQMEDICVIDSDMRIIDIPEQFKVLGVENDKDVKVMQFRMPKVYKGTDLSAFNISVNYQNARGTKDRYVVTDKKVSGDQIEFSWTVGKTATVYRGDTRFIVCMRLTGSDGIIQKEFNTTLATMTVLEGLEVDNPVIEQEEKDIIAQLLQIVDDKSKEAVQAVTAEGTKQIKAVQDAAKEAVKNEAEEAVRETVQESIDTITTETEKQKELIVAEGTKQVEIVAEEGTKQLEIVQGAAQEIVADREQIQTNKQDIADLRQSKADVMVHTAKGSHITVNNSADAFFEGLKIYGKSEQVQTKGYQLFDASEVKPASMGGATVTANSDGSYTVSGTGRLTKDFWIGGGYSHDEVLKLFKAGKLTVSAKATMPKVYVSLSGSKGKHFEIYAGETVNITKEMLEDTNLSVGFGIYGSTSEEIIPGTVKPMIYQDGDGTWEPYTGGKPSPSMEYKQDPESSGDGGTIGIGVRGNNLYYEGDLSISDAKYTDFIPWTGKSKMFASLRAKTNSVDGSLDVVIDYYDANKVRLGGNGWGGLCGNTFTKYSTIFTGKSAAGTGKNVDLRLVRFFKVKFGIFVDSATQIDYKDIVITDSEGVKFSGYQPPQTLTIPTPNGLPGIKVTSDGNYTDSNGQQWVCDEMDFKRGKYVQRVKKVVFDGSKDEVWRREFSYVYILINDSAPLTIPIVNKFVGVKNSNSNANTNNCSTISSSSALTCCLTGITDGELQVWTTHLQTNPIEVLYILATPIETDIPEEVMKAYRELYTNSPTTVIQNDSDAYMEVDYASYTHRANKDDVDDLRALVQAQQVDIANLLSLMPLEIQAAMIENDTNNILNSLESEVTK